MSHSKSVTSRCERETNLRMAPECCYRVCSSAKRHRVVLWMLCSLALPLGLETAPSNIKSGPGAPSRAKREFIEDSVIESKIGMVMRLNEQAAAILNSFRIAKKKKEAIWFGCGVDWSGNKVLQRVE
ncbi:hypothetical protein J437_LFUL016986 [Ladona fulva]|uniref:Uncharacterized protein n=1 Tax=Ladona fulva TaxID=123851 RepID=A0A8K0P840_LADFU|nr:hypothetical protein J437_LFUL016986 [Ladona fulva]